ncbi:hypothetical protein EAI_03259, partial [Harpegnathos saltator]
RPLHCYKCLKYGHMAAAYQSEVGLGGRCFRCGEADHVARRCPSDVRCTLCQYEGRYA